MPFREIEERQRAFWRDHAIFRRSVEERPADRIYSFYEGPPTANGRPGMHHVLGRAFKDLFPRYKTMQGYRAPRKGGWDTHGLPVELEIERELGLSNKAEIEEYGIAKFNQQCRDSVMRYVQQWEDLTERIAFWLDMDDPYITYHPKYVESCWWIFKTLWDAGLIYEARRSTPHCPRCETSLSSHELALGYEDNTPDPSVYVKFRADRELLPESLRDFDGDTYLVAWTTTPWTLPGNTALAVAEKETYAVVPVGPNERLILAQPRLEPALSDALDPIPTPTQTVRGADLVGVTYAGLYEPDAWGVPAFRFQNGRLLEWTPGSDTQPKRRVLAAEFVSMEDGTGIVHIAPAFGVDDYTLGREAGLLFVQPVDLSGHMLGQGAPFEGKFVKDADPVVMDDLLQRGLLLKRETIRHTYPFCWRCHTPLLYYAKPSWYIATTQIIDSLTRTNREEMQWYPEHVRDGRYGDWLANNTDWAVSRERYWGTPLPFWRCRGCNHADAVGSFEELQQRGRREDGAPVDLSDPHRPYVDDIVIDCPQCNGVMRRVPEVADAWFDSGAMPYAQWHYPFENQDVFAERFPAEFICEGSDQTRGWFYSLHAEAGLLHHAGAVPSPIAYRNVICLGLILDEAGEKMSKSRGNIADPWEVIDERGADAVRWYMYTAGLPGNSRRFSSSLVGEAQRRFLLTLWNTYSFFVTYANVDGFDPSTPPPAERPDLDRWVRSALHDLVRSVTASLENYDPNSAGRAIEQFVDELSNWYVRRSRRRFWKSVDDADKASAYHTLYECLVTLGKLLAPFTPYVAEEIYRNLVASVDADAPESVHLAHWPEVDATLIDSDQIAAMRLVQQITSRGRAARSKAGVKVRQPLPEMLVGVGSPQEAAQLERYQAMVLDEINVKQLTLADASAKLVRFVIKPNLPVLGPRLREDVERLRNVLKSLDAEMAAQVATAAGAGESIEVEGFALQADDLLIETREREGATAAQEGQYTVALITDLTPALEQEGLARELVHRIQSARREAGFEIADRMDLWIGGDAPAALAAATTHAKYLQAETLALALHLDTAAPDGAYRAEEDVDGETVQLALIKR